MKNLLFLACCSLAYGQITITETAPVAAQGGTTTLHATGNTGSVTWSLTGGSVGSINPSTGVYTAPSTVSVKAKAGPCAITPPDHVFNTAIDTLPLAANSFEAMADVYLALGSFSVNTGTDVFTYALSASQPPTIVSNATPLIFKSSTASYPAPIIAGTTYYARDVSGLTFKIAATIGGTAIDITTSGGGELSFTTAASQVYNVGFEPTFPHNITNNSYPTWAAVFNYTPSNNGTYIWSVWPNLRNEGGVFLTPNLVDNHELFINRDTCTFLDVYSPYPAGTIPGNPTATAQSGVQYGFGFPLPTTGATDAAGMEQQPFNTSWEEVVAALESGGDINHAWRMSMANFWIKRSNVWPATTFATYPYCTDYAVPGLSNIADYCFNYGDRIRLKASFDISGYSAAAQVILRSWKKYGIILADGGTNFAVQVNRDWNWSPAGQAVAAEIGNYTLRGARDFELVDESSLHISDASGSVNISNGYVTLTEYAEVVATDSMGSASVRVALQGITIGTDEPVVTVVAGHTWTPNIWVTGTAATTFSCAQSPSVGTVNSSTGALTPTTTATPTTTRLTCTSSADSTKKTYIDVNVWPDQDGGAIYADLGDTTSRSWSGHTWYPENYLPMDKFPASVWPGGTAGTVYQNAAYSYNDLTTKVYLPNGAYAVTMYISINAGAYNPATDYLIDVDVNNTLYYTDWGEGSVVGGATYTGGYFTVVANVTNGYMTVSFRRRTESGFTATNMAGLSIVPTTLPQTVGGKVSFTGKTAVN